MLQVFTPESNPYNDRKSYRWRYPFKRNILLTTIILYSYRCEIKINLRKQITFYVVGGTTDVEWVQFHEVQNVHWQLISLLFAVTSPGSLAPQRVCFSAVTQAWCSRWIQGLRSSTEQSHGTTHSWQSATMYQQDPCLISNAHRALSHRYASHTVRCFLVSKNFRE